MGIGRSQRRAAQRGQATILVTMSLVGMFGLMGLVVDIGWAYWRREAAKTAAEAAVAAVVLAAGTTTPTAQSGTACPSSPDPLVAWQVGCIYASQNGFTQGVSRRSVSIQIGNGSTGIPVGGVSPNKYWVAATVSESMPTLFSAVLGKTNMTVSARSTSAVYNGSPGGCIYVLNGTANNAFKVSGGTTNGACGFYVNSTSTSSFNLTGGNINLGTSGAKINLHAGSISPWPPTGGTVLPSLSSVQMSQPAVSNPITGLTAPTAGSCTPDPNITSGTHTLTQGTYCSGITIKGGTVTLSAGLYQFTNAGANFKISGGSQYVDATAGVTLYFAPGAGQLVVSGNGLNLTAPVGGTWDGIAVWKASSCSPLPGCDYWSWTGGNVNVNGVIDLPNSFLKYTGGATGVAQTIVCDTFETTGGNITGPASSKYFTGSGSGSGGGGAYLVE